MPEFTLNNYRDETLDEKGRQCDVCNSKEDIKVHHIDGDRRNNSLKNLVPLCQDCHSKVHTVVPDDSGSAHQQLSAKLKPMDERAEPGDAVRITVSLPDDVDQRLHDDLEYGDNRSAVVAEAIREYFDMEAA